MGRAWARRASRRGGRVLRWPFALLSSLPTSLQVPNERQQDTNTLAPRVTHWETDTRHHRSPGRAAHFQLPGAPAPAGTRRHTRHAETRARPQQGHTHPRPRHTRWDPPSAPAPPAVTTTQAPRHTSVLTRVHPGWQVQTRAAHFKAPGSPCAGSPACRDRETSSAAQTHTTPPARLPGARPPRAPGPQAAGPPAGFPRAP